MSKFLLMLVCAALLGIASCAVPRLDAGGSSYNSVSGDKNAGGNNIVPVYDEDDSDDEGVVDEDIEIDGIAIKYLSETELKDLLDDEDNVLMSSLDILVVQKDIKDRVTGGTGSAMQGAWLKGSRQKRWIGLAARGLYTAGRTLFRGAVRAARTTRSGNRITQSYSRRGNFNTATRDFNRFRPDNVRPINGRFRGQTGTVGNHRFTVRSGSREGSPTLEIRSPRPDGSTYVRKFRYGE